MDNADIAQNYQEIMLAQHLATAIVRPPAASDHNKNDDGDYECIDCGEIVEPQRVRLGLTLRCIACQQLHEKQ
ncbi:MAG: TraR/DksA C4-type zinc finger protein [Psychrobacter sp.]|uniref:TraR/DksA C4-type zinc finger protein n=1 Tax=Psychrobacter sp. TaxID=56811 RepID=UPI00264A22E2|nr:TraR/DksA C4-type zinc finger protein [Psychrobacter sp.]MDN5619247.1 TraR/DksA C4-type zinc finger protein [Psychrobacter sp.]